MNRRFLGTSTNNLRVAQTFTNLGLMSRERWVLETRDFARASPCQKHAVTERPGFREKYALHQGDSFREYSKTVTGSYGLLGGFATSFASRRTFFPLAASPGLPLSS